MRLRVLLIRRQLFRIYDILSRLLIVGTGGKLALRIKLGRSVRRSFFFR